MIRNAAAQDIVAFLGILEPRNWPECLTLLVNQLDDQDPVHQEVRFTFPPSDLFRFGFGWASHRQPTHSCTLCSCQLGIRLGCARNLNEKLSPPLSRSHRGIGKHVLCLVYMPSLSTAVIGP